MRFSLLIVDALIAQLSVFIFVRMKIIWLRDVQKAQTNKDVCYCVVIGYA